MVAFKQGVLRGLFQGFDGPGTIYEFTDGERWRQVCDTVRPHRAFMPDARITKNGEKYFLQVEALNVFVEVSPTL